MTYDEGLDRVHSATGDTSWAALLATKEAYWKQAHRLAAENAELRAKVEQEIKNWKNRNRSACEAEQEIVRLNGLLDDIREVALDVSKSELSALMEIRDLVDVISVNGQP